MCEEVAFNDTGGKELGSKLSAIKCLMVKKITFQASVHNFTQSSVLKGSGVVCPCQVYTTQQRGCCLKSGHQGDFPDIPCSYLSRAPAHTRQTITQPMAALSVGCFSSGGWGKVTQEEEIRQA